MQRTSSSSCTLWQQVGGVAILLAAIVVCWSAYGFYQPQILDRLGFPLLASWLGIGQGLLGAIVEPYVGFQSDRLMAKAGNRLPMIAIGIALAGLIFIVLAFLLEQRLSPAFAWIIPILMTLWVMAMIIFRGPAIALLRQFAPTANLPQANGILTFVLGLSGALDPLLQQFFSRIGSTGTFLFGALCLLIGGVAIGVNQPTVSIPDLSYPRPAVAAKRSIFIFIVGAAAGMEAFLLLKQIPLQLQPTFTNVLPQYITAIILLISAITAVPLEKYINILGIRKSMTCSLGMIVTLLLMSPLVTHWITATILLTLCGTAMGLLFIDQIPFALTRVPPELAGWGTGLYFGGMGSAIAIANLIQQLGGFSAWTISLLAITAFAMAVICLNKLKREF
ncbi:MFS transporter [Alkalinema sp. FACHB-956]|uniref:MFS transporter n=1 Tax=Alkalinema sp. FACHB-956 TaxID=2692768 RepID=UPI0016826D8A|nr:MFS transporter [Alkalinema sp. FACHB-956]MBD2325957.1 MFS transporter [Alkalinema sp. FACHB-956]